MTNERLLERSIPDRSPGHAFVRMTRVGIYSRTNDIHETGPPKSEQLPSWGRPCAHLASVIKYCSSCRRVRSY